MPDDLKLKIASAAEAAGRSLHAELLVRLEESFESSDSVPKAQYELLEQHVVAMKKTVEAGKRIEANLERIIEVERQMSVMYAKSVIGLGDRLRGVLGTLDPSKDSPQIRSLRADVLSAMSGARVLLKDMNTDDREIDAAMVHTTVRDLEARGAPDEPPVPIRRRKLT